MSYIDEGQRSRRGFAAWRSGKGIFRGALHTGYPFEQIIPVHLRLPVFYIVININLNLEKEVLYV
jgi:hypothetical protein